MAIQCNKPFVSLPKLIRLGQTGSILLVCFNFLDLPRGASYYGFSRIGYLKGGSLKFILSLFLVFSSIVLLVNLSHCKTLVDSLDGKKIDLDGVNAKAPVVLNFWATWCGPCRLELPHLQKIYEEYSAKGIVFMAVSLDNPKQRQKVGEYLKNNGITMPVYIDTKGELAKRFKISAIPATFILAKGGSVFYQTRGYRPGDEILLRKKIDSLLESQKQPRP